MRVSIRSTMMNKQLTVTDLCVLLEVVIVLSMAKAWHAQYYVDSSICRLQFRLLPCSGKGSDTVSKVEGSSQFRSVLKSDRG